MAGGNDENTLLLLHGDSFTDSSPQGVAITNSGVTVSTAQSKFGGSSLYFNGSSRLTFDPINFGSNDFTIDWWEYVNSTTTGTRFTNVFSNAYLTEAGGILIGAYEGGSSRMYVSSYGSDRIWDILSNAMCFSEQPIRWIHRAIVRHGNRLMTFADGMLDHEHDVGTMSIGYDPTKQSAIGAWASDMSMETYNYNGYIDEFRISNIARWTYDFIPSDREYASPEEGPTAPAALSVSYTDDAKASLTWSKVSNAEKYRIYRDMSMIAETDTTSYTDAGTLTPYAHEYAVTGVNEFGESRLSDAMRAESWGVVAPNLIFDRTLADIETAKTLMTKRLAGMTLTTEEEDAWDKGLRGCYNTSDVNRVEYHTRELQGILNANGYNIHIDTRLWAKSDIMRYSDIVIYLGNIETVLDAFGRSANAPVLPTIEKWIDYIAANDIEKILLATRELIYGALAMFRRAGTFAAGNDYHAQIIRRA